MQLDPGGGAGPKDLVRPQPAPHLLTGCAKAGGAQGVAQELNSLPPPSPPVGLDIAHLESQPSCEGRRPPFPRPHSPQVFCLLLIGFRGFFQVPRVVMVARVVLEPQGLRHTHFLPECSTTISAVARPSCFPLVLGGAGAFQHPGANPNPAGSHCLEDVVNFLKRRTLEGMRRSSRRTLAPSVDMPVPPVVASDPVGDIAFSHTPCLSRVENLPQWR